MSCPFVPVYPFLVPGRTTTMRNALPVLLTLIASTATAQILDDTLRVPEVEVIGHRTPTDLTPATTTWSAEDIRDRAGARLTDLLFMDGGISVRSALPGALSTASVRGGSAQQTAVLWNGLPISNPMIGQADLGLLPAQLADQVSLERGPSDRPNAVSTIGGAVSITDDLTDRGQALVLRNEIGSFGTGHRSLRFDGGIPALRVSVRAVHLQADNDFSFRRAPSLPDELRENAFVDQGGIQVVAGGDIHHFDWSVHGWSQWTERGIPAHVEQSRSLATQGDVAHRVLARGGWSTDRTTVDVRAAVFDEVIDYRDPMIDLRSRTRFRTIFAEASAHHRIGRALQLGLTAHQRWTTAYADAYGDPPTEPRTLVTLNAGWTVGRAILELDVQQQVVDGRFDAPIPVLSWQHDWTEHVHTQLRARRVLRRPTLNDRFWVPGGDVDLRAEQGWGGDASLVWGRRWGQHGVQAEATGFQRLVFDQILWAQPEGQSFWQATNLAEVHSRGLELRVSSDHRLGGWTVQTHLAYDWVRSTNRQALRRPRIRAGDQLTYVPEHALAARFEARSRQWMGWLRYRFLGERPGQLSTLGAVHTADAAIGARWTAGRHRGDVRFEVHNITDARFVLIDRQPMPGRSVHLRFTYSFSSISPNDP
mgnify:CR=1 FL=1